MSGYYPHASENKLLNIVRAVRDALDGRSNAFGEFTITHDTTTTVVLANNCSPESCISLMPVTANAAAAIGAGTAYILAANIITGQFTITHANNAQTDRTFRYAIQG